MNHISVIGNLGQDPELRYTPNGQATCKFSLAVNRSYQQGGEWKTETDWINVVCWRGLAENVAETLTKGTRVLVVGRISQREWDDSEGGKRSTIEIQAEDVGVALRWATVGEIKKQEKQGS